MTYIGHLEVLTVLSSIDSEPPSNLGHGFGLILFLSHSSLLFPNTFFDGLRLQELRPFAVFKDLLEAFFLSAFK